MQCTTIGGDLKILVNACLINRPIHGMLNMKRQLRDDFPFSRVCRLNNMEVTPITLSAKATGSDSVLLPYDGISKTYLLQPGLMDSSYSALGDIRETYENDSTEETTLTINCPGYNIKLCSFLWPHLTIVANCKSVSAVGDNAFKALQANCDSICLWGTKLDTLSSVNPNCSIEILGSDETKIESVNTAGGSLYISGCSTVSTVYVNPLNMPSITIYYPEVEDMEIGSTGTTHFTIRTTLPKNPSNLKERCVKSIVTSVLEDEDVKEPKWEVVTKKLSEAVTDVYTMKCYYCELPWCMFNMECFTALHTVKANCVGDKVGQVTEFYFCCGRTCQ